MEICYCGHPKERHNRKCKEERNRLETNYYVSACYHCVCKEYAHNELLETHTVNEERWNTEKSAKKIMEETLYPTPPSNSEKEECCCDSVMNQMCTKHEEMAKELLACYREEVKEEPTTPEKKCCDDCKKYELGVNCQCVCHGVLPRHQGEKLPTSSYEVTCGRCEKSIKHSC